MNPSDFLEQAPGTLVRSLDGYWTYVPAPLPTTLIFPARLAKRLAEAERALGELASLCNQLKNPFLFLHPFIAREAVLSSRIEGTVTRLEQLLLFDIEPSEGPDSADAEEVLNYVHAVNHGIEALGRMPLCLRLIRDVHATLMTGVRGHDKRPGQFRQVPVAIARTHQDFHQARFVPPAPDQLEALLNGLEQFLNPSEQSDELPLVARLALAHYQFEAIHPFMDGNGRMGRLLVTLMLHASGVLTKPILYLSAYLEAHDQTYRDHLLAISQRGTWLEWIDFFAQGVCSQAQDAAQRARELLLLNDQYRETTQQATQSSSILRLVDHLFNSPFITIPGAAQVMQVSHTAATKSVEKLLQLQILTETHPGRKTRRVFHAPEVLRILNASETP